MGFFFIFWLAFTLSVKKELSSPQAFWIFYTENGLVNKILSQLSLPKGWFHKVIILKTGKLSCVGNIYILYHVVSLRLIFRCSIIGKDRWQLVICLKTSWPFSLLILGFKSFIMYLFLQNFVPCWDILRQNKQLAHHIHKYQSWNIGKNPCSSLPGLFFFFNVITFSELT